MNYGLALSLKMEEQIKKLEMERAEKLQRGEELPDDDGELEEKALELAIEETYEESGRKFRPWARNARALRVGEIILIVDSDTIVPEVRLHSTYRRRILNGNRTASAMPPASSRSALRSPSSSTSPVSFLPAASWPTLNMPFQMSCRSRTTTLRTVSPTLRVVLTSASLSAALTARLRHSSDITLSCAGRRSRMLHSRMRATTAR